MRIILALLTMALIWPAAEAAPRKNAFHGQIYSFDQIMRLTPKKRAQYLRDLTQVVLEMEKQQKKWEVAELSRLQEMKEQIALLMRMMAVLPEAAADEAAGVSAIVPVWNEKKGTFECSGQGAWFNVRVGTCALYQPGNSWNANFAKGTCPAGTHAINSYTQRLTFTGYKDYWDLCIPQASWDRFPNKEAAQRGEWVKNWRNLTVEQRKAYAVSEPKMQTASASATVAPAEATTAQAAAAQVTPASPESASTATPATAGAQTPAAEPGGETGAIPAAKEASAEAPAATQPQSAGGACQPPQDLACKQLSAADLAKLKGEFRTGDSKNECVTAGNFLNYRNNVSKAGNCSYRYAFPDEKAENKITCSNGQALCNPLLFCAGVDISLGEGKSTFLPAAICVPKGNDMTKNCLAKFEEATVKQKNRLDFSKLKKMGHKDLFQQASRAKPRSCDFGKDLENFTGLKEEYNKLKASVEERYSSLCSGDSKFQAMFCTECEVIGKQIYAMNQRGGLGGCAGAESAAPASTGGEALTAPRPEEGAPKTEQ